MNSRSSRRELLQGAGVLGLGLVAGCSLPFSPAQQPTPVHRIGFLIGTTPAQVASVVEAFRQGLEHYGWVEGQNLAVEYRYAEGQRERLPAFAAELVAGSMEAIVVLSTPDAQPALEATSTIPIV